VPFVTLKSPVRVCSCSLYLPLNDHRKREGECRALARLRLDPDFSPVHFDDTLRYSKPQAGTPLLARNRIVGLLKLLKELGLIGRRDAWPSVPHGYMKGAVVGFCLDGDFACVGELDGIADAKPRSCCGSVSR
jgi:hypothetical protein